MKTPIIVAALTIAAPAFALRGNPNVRFTTGSGFALIRHGVPALIQTDEEDWPGVRRAAVDLGKDLANVVGQSGKPAGNRRVIVGTIGKSPTIDGLIRMGKLDVRAVRGKWESSVTQVVGDTLVIAGSDKRGTIFALYDLSEAAGVSPWSWWADVPIKHHEDVSVSGRYVAKEPVVKYRGIFINDEAPALSGWATEKFGGFNHQFYEHVFELLLRLKANYLWPAMWGRSFGEDDPLNAKTADEYGIVMGTSHVEPMMRADIEWNRLGYTEAQWNYDTHPKELENFWREGLERNRSYEKIVTIAMRGKVDTPMAESAKTELLEGIVAAQRRIITKTLNPDVAEVPQLWCLYKEVQEYYEKGMRVPDDVTLLWSDDNWGDIRRLPTSAERKRSGGAGVYYHFDYVGGPRNYKWIDTNPLPKIWEQMNLAYRYDANRIWVVNVGDIKPMELPMDFFLTMALDPGRMRKEDLEGFTQRWAEQQFGSAHAQEIAAIISETKRLCGLRKPELLSPETYSVVNYDEAERIADAFRDCATHAERVGRQLPQDAQSAYYQLVVHPIKAPAIVQQMYVAAAKNALYAQQGRASTNVEAKRARDLFAADAGATNEYHRLNGGKWSHFMDQTHIGYTNWQEPPRNNAPAVQELTALPEGPLMGVAPEDPVLRFDRYGVATHFIDIFRRGKAAFPYLIRTNVPWIHVNALQGTVDEDRRIAVSIDWTKIPEGMSKGMLTVSGAGTHMDVQVIAIHPRLPARGFVEGDGVIAIEPEHTSRRVKSGAIRWETIPGYGRTLSAVAPFPVEFSPFEAGKGPRLEYNVNTFSGSVATLELLASPSLAFAPGHGLRVALAFDDETPKVIDLASTYLSRAWETAVSDAAQKVRTQHSLKPGHHILKIWAIDPGTVIQRIHIDFGGLKPSYLGPAESRRIR